VFTLIDESCRVFVDFSLRRFSGLVRCRGVKGTTTSFRKQSAVLEQQQFGLHHRSGQRSSHLLEAFPKTNW
jgi:hypothetical protein